MSRPRSQWPPSCEAKGREEAAAPWGGAVRAGGALLLQLLGTEAPFNGESLVRLSWGRGRAVACHPSGAQAGSAVLECRASHRPWRPRVDTRPMVLIYRFRPFRAHSSAAIGTLTSSRRHCCAVQGHGAPCPTTPQPPAPSSHSLPPRPPPKGRSLASSLGFARSGRVCRRDHGPCGFRVRLLSPSGTFPGFSVSARVSACPPVSARVLGSGAESCPAARRGARVRPTQPTGGFAWQHSVSAVPHAAELRPGARTRPGSPRGPVTRRDPRLGVPVTSH